MASATTSSAVYSPLSARARVPVSCGNGKWRVEIHTGFDSCIDHRGAVENINTVVLVRGWVGWDGPGARKKVERDSRWGRWVGLRCREVHDGRSRESALAPGRRVDAVCGKVEVSGPKSKTATARASWRRLG